MRKILSLLSVMLLVALVATAQTRPITGRVTDEQGNPVEGASVVVKGTTSGTAADAQGNFRISAKTGDVLVISATNFGTREFSVTASTSTVNASLSRGTAVIDEVVVTALGIQRQRKDLGYSTAKVDNQTLTQARPVNVASGLQGKVSGLNVTTVNNGVFQDVKINLRGIRSLTGNNNPMLLLDGVAVGIAFLSTLNPNDIADVTILKGASAAGIYGPDARNGVIVVTTKRGTRGERPVITVSNTTQFERIAFLPEMQQEFGSGGYGDYIAYENWSWGPAFDGTVRPLGHTLPDGSIQEHTYIARPDEKKKFFNTGITTQNDISFATKDFYFSFQDANIKGIVPGDKNRRTGIRVNTGKEYGIFKMLFNVNYAQQNYDVFDNQAMSDYHTAQNIGLNDGLMNLIFSTPANVPITSYKDYQNNKFAQYNNYFNDYGINPYFALDNWRAMGKTEDLLTNIDMNLKAASWISLTFRAGATARFNTARSISKGEAASSYGKSRGIADVPGAVSETANRSSRLSTEAFATITKSFTNIKMNLIAGGSYRQSDTKGFNSASSPAGLIVPELYTLSNSAGSISGGSNTTRTRLGAVYGSLGLSYKGWANLEITGRNEWTSVLAIGNNSFFYPGANLSLVLTDVIDGLKGSKISYLKLRGSINKTGNADINAYSLESTFGGSSSGFPYGTLAGYTANNTSYDPNLKPEQIISKEAGFELGLFRNRLNIEVAYFNQDNTDQFVAVPVSGATGYTTLFRNAASFVNKGVEMDVRLTPVVKFRKGNIEIRANATYNTSTVKSIYQDLDRIQIGGYPTIAANYAVAGYPAFVWLMSDYDRDPMGRIIVNPVSGMPTKNPNLQIFGRTMPTWIVGLTPTINWNGASLSVVGEYRTGHYNYNHIGAEMAWTGVSAATARNHRERFVVPNSVYWNGSKYVENTSIAVSNVNDFYTGTNTFRGVGTNFLTSAASWRIREISLGYQVPLSIFGRQGVIKGLNISLVGRNIALWLPESNEFTDPDFNFSTGNTSGINNATINPPTRIFGGNITVTF
jgi:TonB-linked SusC/RagA family outer membrane protein